MSFCGYQPPETKRENCIRQWNMAKEVYKRLVNGNYNKMQIELFKNVLIRVDAIGTISYHYAHKQIIKTTRAN